MAQTQKKKSFANILSGGDKTVALDIGSRFVKLAILHRRKNSVEARYLDQMAIPFASSRGDVTPEAVKETVRQILQRNKIKDIGVLSVMSRDFVTVSHLELPSTDREQIKQMLVFEAESHLPFAMERAITSFDFKPIENQPEPGGEEKKEGDDKATAPHSSKVIFAAVRQALIPKFLELHTQKGLKQTAIQVSSFAIFNLYDYLRRSGKIGKAEGDTLIVEMGARRTEFILVNAEDELVFTRNVDKGGDELTSYVASKEGISFEEAEQRKIEKWEETPLSDPAELLAAMEGLTNEVDRTLRFIKNRGISKNISRVCFSGGGSQRAEVCRILSAPCGVEEPLYLNGLDLIETKRKNFFGPSFSAALGAALAQIGESAVYIDLLPVDVVKLQLLAMRRKMLIKLAVGVAAVALLALLILGAAVLISNAKVDAKNAELKSKLQETKKVDLLEKRNAQLQKAVNDIEGVISRKTSWNSVLSGISSCMTSNVWVTSIGVDKNNTMTLEGYSRNSDYLIFEENMQRQLRFENVIVPSEKTMVQYGLQVHYFKLTCDILPDYKYNEKLRALISPGGEGEEASGETKTEPLKAAPPAGGEETLKAEPEQKKEEKPEDIMTMPEQGTPFRMSNPASAPVAPRSRVTELPARSGSEDAQAAPAPAAPRPARSARLMDKKKEAENTAAVAAAEAEAKKEAQENLEKLSSEEPAAQEDRSVSEADASEETAKQEYIAGQNEAGEEAGEEAETKAADSDSGSAFSEWKKGIGEAEELDDGSGGEEENDDGDEAVKEDDK
ncbi:pilus assembly protein PilM [bacterium]|nr:pilus assembly protein PilM [bacterium]